MYQETKEEKQLKNNCYLLYTIAFAAVAAIVFSYFYLNGKTLISHGDGFKQHYKALLYYSRYLKDVFHTVFVNHSLNIPMFDMSIGEGADILGAMHYYCIGDPFAFLSVFVPEAYMYICYDAIVIAKMYLAGLFFVALCRYTGRNNIYGVLSGSLIYTFCYWTMLNSNKHVFFLSPMVYLPLIILGVEKIIREDKPILFTVSVAICALSHIYFFYMNVLLTVIYVALRLITLYKFNIKAMVITVVKLFVHALLSLGMAAVILCPIAFILLHNNRIGVDYNSPLFYSRFYYERLFTILFADDYPYWLCMGFASPVVLSMAMTVRNIRKHPLIFLLNVAALAMISFPIVGRVFNGMGYIANRWSYALALLFGYTFAYEYEEFEDHKKFLIFAVPAFLLAGYVSAWSRTIRVIVPTAICLLYLAVVLLKFRKGKDIILLLILVSCIAFNADHIYSERGDDKRAISATSIEDAKNVVTSNEAYEFKEYTDENGIRNFVRFTGNDLSDNVAMLNGTYGTNYYFSMANPYTATFRAKLGVSEYSAYRFYSLDERAGLFSIGNVGYYLAKPDYEGVIPFGFRYVKDLDNYKLYKNVNTLPFGYTYSRAISYDLWDQFNTVEKEEAMLKAIVVENGSDPIALSSNKVVFTMRHGDDIELKNGTIIVKEKDAKISLDFNGKTYSENYVMFSGLSYWDGKSYYDESLTDVEIDVVRDDFTRTIEYHTNDYSFYNARKDFVAYMGYDDKALSHYDLVFSDPGTYTYKEIAVICRKASVYGSELSRHAEKHLENVVFSTNQVSGTIDLDDERYLLLSIPYSEGFKAYDNGNEVHLLRANECYMGLRLASGHHEITLKYETPYLKIGAIISSASMIVFLAYVVLRAKKKYNQKQKEKNGEITSDTE